MTTLINMNSQDLRHHPSEGYPRGGGEQGSRALTSKAKQDPDFPKMQPLPFLCQKISLDETCEETDDFSAKENQRSGFLPGFVRSDTGRRKDDDEEP